jgi:hypothetical protein
MSTRSDFNMLRCRDAESDSCDSLRAGMMRAAWRLWHRLRNTRMGLPYVEALTTNGLDPFRDKDKWEAVKKAQRQRLVALIPAPHQPVGKVSWNLATGCDNPLPPGQRHWRFRLHHTRS